MLRTIICIILSLITSAAYSKAPAVKTTALPLLHRSLVDSCYLHNQSLFWFNTIDAANKRKQLVALIDNATYLGLDKNKYHYSKIHELTDDKAIIIDSVNKLRFDKIYTDAAIALCKDIYQGTGIQNFIHYDEWSPKYASRDNNYIISHLVAAKSSSELVSFINSLEPATEEYLAYKTELNVQISLKNKTKTKQVANAMNFYRWVHHFKFEKMILVNIGSATLRYYERDKEILFSRVIVGKPSTKSPRFAAQCTQVILYPYWNVPSSILFKELLPKYKKSPGLVSAQNMQVVDAAGHVVDHTKLNWSRYSRSYFPYRIRQSTGCDNSLGVLKLDLTDPFGVYLHDTNAKGLFASNNRYRSHGCIRIEKALELGNYLLYNKLDTAFLNKCLKDQNPTPIKLDKPVPVFVIYNTVQQDSTGVVKYYKDTYRLLQ